MPSSADWITLAEAADILAAANVRFRPATIGAWARSGACRASSSAAAATSDGARSGALVVAPRRVHSEDVQPGLFEDLSSPSRARRRAMWRCPTPRGPTGSPSPTRRRAVVRTLAGVFDTYDQAGGGLVAGGLEPRPVRAAAGLSSSSLSVFGLVVTDPAVAGAAGRRDRDCHSAAGGSSRRPPSKQVSAGAVPGGIIAVIGLRVGVEPLLLGSGLRDREDLPPGQAAQRDRPHRAGRPAHAPARRLPDLRRVRGSDRPGPDHLRAASKGPAELGRLVVLASPHGEPPVATSFPLDAVTTVGRDVNNTIVIDDPFASAEHFALTFRGPRLVRGGPREHQWHVRQRRARRPRRGARVRRRAPGGRGAIPPRPGSGVSAVPQARSTPRWTSAAHAAGTGARAARPGVRDAARGRGVARRGPERAAVAPRGQAGGLDRPDATGPGGPRHLPRRAVRCPWRVRPRGATDRPGPAAGDGAAGRDRPAADAAAAAGARRPAVRRGGVRARPACSSAGS